MPSQFTYHTYGLLCPLNNKIRYVGQFRNVVEQYKHHIKPLDVNKRNDIQANGLPFRPKHYWLMDLRERGMRPEPIILQTLAAKPESCGETLRVIEAERGWINRLLNARHPLTNRARERTTPISVQERDAHIGRQILSLSGLLINSEPSGTIPPLLRRLLRLYHGK